MNNENEHFTIYHEQRKRTFYDLSTPFIIVATQLLLKQKFITYTVWETLKIVKSYCMIYTKVRP